MLKAVRTLPFFRILAVGRLVLTARRHLQSLTPVERRRLAQLVRHGRSLTPAERDEVRSLVGKLEPRAFAGAVAQTFAPFRVPGRRR
jgi:hypothetical protein